MGVRRGYLKYQEIPNTENLPIHLMNIKFYRSCICHEQSYTEISQLVRRYCFQ